MSSKIKNDPKPSIADLVRTEDEIQKLALALGEADWRAPIGGGWCAAEHLLHVVKTIEVVHAAFENMVPRLPLPRRKSDNRAWARRVVFLTHRIPRGRKAPDRVVPEAVLSRDEVIVRLRKARDSFIELLPRLITFSADRCWLEHPALGPLSPAEWSRFILIHTRHHLRIVGKAASHGA